MMKLFHIRDKKDPNAIWEVLAENTNDAINKVYEEYPEAELYYAGAYAVDFPFVVNHES